jgi:hypothetical protein
MLKNRRIASQRKIWHLLHLSSRFFIVDLLCASISFIKNNSSLIAITVLHFCWLMYFFLENRSLAFLYFYFLISHLPWYNRKEELGEGKEKVTTSEECELVTLMSVIKGRIEISRGWICFWDSGLGNEVDRERVDFKFALHQLQEVHLRRYNLRRSALEFFLTDHTNYFVNFTTKVWNLMNF